ncbi:MAG: NAD(P)H-dependent oxidoreductase [Deltaproteobacteria bacterium]|nr:NAD(P)H-dependent oxidoreductase [Deltaproteobacteria bacterium]MBI2341357.1 NAD(P)H-dependent oxidoreductase [Deltaproteobacteria bacterium]
MNKLLHIIASPRGEESRTLKVSKAFLDAFKKKNPSCVIDELNAAAEALPSLTLKMVSGKYVLLGGKNLTGELAEAWKPIEKEIERFLSADAYLISAPMWNFSIPYTLKQYIDLIIQPKYLFRYTPKGVEGMAKGRKMLVVTSRGGDYSHGASKSYDFQEPYLKTIFGFVGISDITFINAEPMDALGPDVGSQKVAEACEKAKKTAASW